MLGREKNYGEEIGRKRIKEKDFIEIDTSKDFVNEIVFIDTEEPGPPGKAKTKRINPYGDNDKKVLQSRFISKSQRQQEVIILQWVFLFVIAALGTFAIMLFIYENRYYNNKLETITGYFISNKVLASIHYLLYYAREIYSTNYEHRNQKDFLGYNSTEGYVEDLYKKLERRVNEFKRMVNQQKAIDSVIYTEEGVIVEHMIGTHVFIYNTYTLFDALQEFTASLFEIRNIVEINAKLYYFHSILINGFASIDEKLSKEVDKFKDRAYDIVDYNMKKITVLRICAFVIIALFVIVFCYLIYRTNRNFQTIMNFLLDIPYASLTELAKRCEGFNDLITSEEFAERKFVAENLVPRASIHNKRKYKNQFGFLKCSVVLVIFFSLIIVGYYIFNCLTELSYRSRYKKFLAKLINAARIEADFQASLNDQIECLYYKIGANYTLPRPCKAIEDAYQRIYEATESLENIESICNINYANKLIDIFQHNLCENRFGIVIELPGKECEEFVEGSTKEGLTTVLLYFLKLIREFSLRNASASELLKNEDLATLYLLQKVFIGPFMRAAIEVLLDSETERATFMQNIKVTLLIIFFVVLFSLYLILWLPTMNLIENRVSVCLMVG